MTNCNPRLAQLLDGITRDQKLLEIAPYHNPMVAKRDGYDVHTLDVFSRAELERNMADDPFLSVSTQLEDVDYVGSATEIAALVPRERHGRYDAILSSHNFEHLPNPIKFLRGCERILKPGGRLIMAVPDARATFDIYKPLTTVSEWLEAWLEDRQRPTPKQVFEHHALMAFKNEEGRQVPSSGFEMEHRAIVSDELKKRFEWWNDEGDSGVYQDAHCTIMIPESLEAIILETKILGLVSLEVDALDALPGGYEFMIRLRKNADPNTYFVATDALRRRVALYRLMGRSRQSNWDRARRHDCSREKRSLIESSVRALATRLLGAKRVEAIREWNRNRKVHGTR